MSNIAKEVKATGNNLSNIVDLTASDVSAISPGNGHRSRDKATSSNKSVSNTARKVKITVTVETQILSSDTETEKSYDDLAKEQKCAKNNFELKDCSSEYLSNSKTNLRTSAMKIFRKSDTKN